MGKPQDKALEPARQFQGLAKLCAVTALVAINSACAGGGDTMNTTQTSTSAAKAPKVSLVEAWKMKMTRVDDGHVRIRYAPLLSTMYHSPGANIQSDGKTLTVDLAWCRYKEECPVTITSTDKRTPDMGFHYEVVVPFKGERVIVKSGGPVEEELMLTQ